MRFTYFVGIPVISWRACVRACVQFRQGDQTHAVDLFHLFMAFRTRGGWVAVRNGGLATAAWQDYRARVGVLNAWRGPVPTNFMGVYSIAELRVLEGEADEEDEEACAAAAADESDDGEGAAAAAADADGDAQLRCPVCKVEVTADTPPASHARCKRLMRTLAPVIDGMLSIAGLSRLIARAPPGAIYAATAAGRLDVVRREVMARLRNALVHESIATVCGDNGDGKSTLLNLLFAVLEVCGTREQWRARVLSLMRPGGGGAGVP